ncbi:MAG: 2-C-methyl-D-erythritol 4-phosphate cytidylyltransferase, partial [Pseudomonadota bacterium]|nr:2-C-methyl-D-erythritol 4-phosphate cytidylyltransferase [Pseudomonadota bacterium]
MGAKGRIAALVVAAGSGSRAGAGIPKQFRRIGGKAVVAHAVDHLARAGIGDVHVVVGPGQEALYLEAVEGRTLQPPVTGGAQRHESVRNGLEAIAAEGGA